MSIELVKLLIMGIDFNYEHCQDYCPYLDKSADFYICKKCSEYSEYCRGNLESYEENEQFN
jgi:hypothetical protein